MSRSPARYLWATLIARLFEIVPLTCRYRGADMTIIVLVIETPSVRAILEHIGEPTRPPAISPARPCATQSSKFHPNEPPVCLLAAFFRWKHHRHTRCGAVESPILLSFSVAVIATGRRIYN